MPIVALPNTSVPRKTRRRGVAGVETPLLAPVGPLEFLRSYAEQFRAVCCGSEEWMSQVIQVKEVLVRASRNRHKAIVVGNGGSAAIASHIAVDLTKNALIRAVNFNEPDLITCFANDYGYEQWLAKAIERYGDPGDILIAISSSGRSPNILNACRAARRKEFASVITLSGFSPDNPLRTLGDHNFWAESRAYNLVEATHLFWLLALVDLIIGRAEYPA